uniref:(northern house mosquito) hypothetical protein n=1 Tax=Culex pipiens TaxID=7175 RepID=A0A8D8CLN7_CULPI
MAQVPARNPKYSAADLWPPGSKDRDFPPAAFFPVYVGNFLCQQRAELVARVQQYFASKGLLARMVFVRSAQNDPFQSYQDKTKLYDCLVYLTRQRDAQDAVKYLHRDKYYGHRLNVFPGRTPDIMDPNHSVVYALSQNMMQLPTRLIENHILSATGFVAKSTKRFSTNQLIVQYEGPVQQEKALRDYRYMFAHPLTVELSQQQDFLEEDVIDELRARSQKHSTFLAMCPEKHVLEALYAGTKPDVGPMDWVADPLDFLPKIHKPRENVLFQIAEGTLRKFGITCSFINKTSKIRDKERMAKFKRNAESNGSQLRSKYQKAIEEMFRLGNAKLPWRMTVGRCNQD